MTPWILKALFRYRRMLSVIIIIQVTCAILLALQPRYFQQLVSLAIGGARGTLLAEGLPIITLLAGIYLSGTLLQALGGYIGCTFSSNLLKQLQSDFFEKVSHLPLQFFQRQSSGEFFTQFNNDIGQTQRFIADFCPKAVRECITAVTVILILLYFCPVLLTFTALGIVIVTSFLVVQLNRIMARYARKQRTGWGEINRLFDETVQGIDTLKMFATEKQRRERFEKNTSDFRDLSVRAGSVVAMFSPGIDLISKFGSLLLIFMAYYMISRGNIQLDPFLLFFFYAALLQMSVSNLAGYLANIQAELTAIRKISAFFSESCEQDEAGKTSMLLHQAVSIELQALTFSYPKGRLLYRDANMHIPANSLTVVHGPSGSGKSTLINLLLRFYSPMRGCIKLDGIDIENYTRSELRRKIGVVTQNHFVFNEPLRENLLVAKPDAGDPEIRRALEQAQLGGLLTRFPGGLDEVLDPRGRGMSAGEKQRICIARILLRNSPLMILDEPWSNLDDRARQLLAEVINTAKRSTTIMILTHEDLPALAVDRTYNLMPEQGAFVRAPLMP
jgi:ABC-type multidrug transport system fused ATPase/permease subunit